MANLRSRIFFHCSTTTSWFNKDFTYTMIFKMMSKIICALLIDFGIAAVCAVSLNPGPLSRQAVSSRGDNRAQMQLTDLVCVKYLPTECNPAQQPDCVSEERCTVPQNLHVSCMATWTNTTEMGVKVLIKGCWMHQPSHPCSEGACVSREVNKHSTHEMETYFCCCTGNKCNKEISYIPAEPEVTPPSSTALPDDPSHFPEQVVAALYILAPICILAVIIFMVFWLYRRHTLGRLIEKSQIREIVAVNGAKPDSTKNGNIHSIEMTELIHNGRFAQVWKGKLGIDKAVAIKVFPPQDVDSWVQEQEIYVVHGMRKHPCILNFIHAEVRGSGLQAKYWLVTEFHAYGSLYDCLKARPVSFDETLRIAVSMLTGLAFLHEEIVEKGEIQKPTIVHRDFKSKNVLLKDDFTACIADFGLALKCEHGQTLEDTHGQVGTRRYMAPEVLEGATEFTAIAFRQIDVYAAGLVLWEILSRCRLFPEEELDEYKLPFEEEVGLLPTLMQMQDAVVNQKQRPRVKESWTSDKRAEVICHAMREMWDAEPEARISAGCALERLQGLIAGTNTISSCSSCFTVSYPSPTVPVGELSPLVPSETNV